MKKIFISLLLISFILLTAGCKKEENNFDIKDDIGELIDQKTVKELNSTSYIVLENRSTKETNTIENADDVKNIINVFKNSKKKISTEGTWVGSTLYLNLYNNEDNVIATINVFDHVENNDTLGYINLTTLYNEDNSIQEGIYYINIKDLKKILDNL